MSKTKKNKGKKSHSKQKESVTPKGIKLFMPALIIFILGFLIYANTISHDYALDDSSAIKENFVVKRGFGGMGDIFTKHYRYGYWTGRAAIYRPVVLASFATEWEIAEDSPGFYHFMNILWYALSGVLMLLLLRRIFKDYHIILPFLATLIFIVHPIHTEVVANIKSRDEIMALFFCLGTLYFIWNYLERNKIGHLFVALLLYTVAMFCKENSITFLAIFPLTIFLFVNVSLSKNLITSSVFLLPVAFFLFIRHQILGEFTQSVSVLDNFIVGAPDTASELATAFMMLGKYLQVLIFPHPLVSEYGYSQIATVGVTNWKAILSFLLFVGMTGFAFVYHKKYRVLAFGILSFLITLSIFSNVFITIGSSYGERFLYSPSFGFAIILAWLILKVFKVDLSSKELDLQATLFNNKILLGTVVALTVGYSLRTMVRNPAWADSYHLYHTDLKYAPNSAKMRFHHALELVTLAKAAKGAEATKWFELAEKDFLKAIEIYPDYADGYGELGLLYYRKNDYEKAMYNYQKALEYKPKASIYSNMGIIYFNQGNLDKAREVYEKAIQLDPRFVDALRNLGAVYARNKNFKEAIKYFKQGLEYDPKNATILYYLGLAYRDMGEPEKGKEYRIRANQIDPKLPIN